MIEVDTELEQLRPRIRIVGVGGAGGNAVANMIRNDVRGVDFVVANTDAQALRASPAELVLQLGRRTTEGLGAGSHAEIGKLAAEESIEDIEEILEGADMCFIAAGLGGGTGTGAAPVIARAARAKGILTVGVVTKPFGFEGHRRARAAQAGLEALQEHVDTLIVVPNQNLFRVASPGTTFKQAFDLADEILQQGVRGITDLIVMPGLINLDFADVRTVMRDMGRAMMGTGEAEGDDRAIRAAEAAVANPLIDEAVKGARGLLISITGGEDMGLMEVDEAANHIKELVDQDADIIWGSAFNPELNGRIRVSIVATGLDTGEQAAAGAPKAAEAPAQPAPVRQAAPAPARSAPALPAQPVAAAAPPVAGPAAMPAATPAVAARAAAPVRSASVALEQALRADPRPLAAPAAARPVPPRREPAPAPARPALKLIPPSAEDLAAAEAQRALAAELAQRPSLFDRMALAARHAAGSRLREGAPLPRLGQESERHREPALALG